MGWYVHISTPGDMGYITLHGDGHGLLCYSTRVLVRGGGAIRLIVGFQPFMVFVYLFVCLFCFVLLCFDCFCLVFQAIRILPNGGGETARNVRTADLFITSIY